MQRFILLAIVIFMFTVSGCKKSINEPDGQITAKEQAFIENEMTTSAVPTTGLVAWYRLNLGSGDDNTTYNNNGTAYNTSSATNRKGSAGLATRFNGTSSYIQVPDKSYLSISNTGKLSISVWMKVEVLDFPVSSGGYVHWLGKGVTNQHEYALRMYNKNSDRPNRISCYAFNLSGGLGAGAMVQEPVSIGEWIHIVAVYDYPNDKIRIYKNSKLIRTGTFSSYNITPQNGTAPLRIGTRDFASYFKGCLDDLRIYNKVLTQSEIDALYTE